MRPAVVGNLSDYKMRSDILWHFNVAFWSLFFVYTCQCRGLLVTLKVVVTRQQDIYKRDQEDFKMKWNTEHNFFLNGICHSTGIYFTSLGKKATH